MPFIHNEHRLLGSGFERVSCIYPAIAAWAPSVGLNKDIYAAATEQTSGGSLGYASGRVCLINPRTSLILRAGSSASGYTVIAVGTYPTYDLGQFLGSDQYDSAKPRIFQFRRNSSNLDFIVFNTAGSPFSASAALSSTNSEILQFVCGVVTDTRVYAVTGGAAGVKAIGSASISGTLRALSVGSQVFVGMRQPTTNPDYYYGKIALYAVLPFPLAINDIYRLASNPWQIFTPERRIIYFDVTSGATNRRNRLSLLGF